MPKYIVEVQWLLNTSGTQEVEVEADDPDEAAALAIEEFDSDLALESVMDSEFALDAAEPVQDGEEEE